MKLLPIAVVCAVSIIAVIIFDPVFGALPHLGPGPVCTTYTLGVEQRKRATMSEYSLVLLSSQKQNDEVSLSL